MEERNDDLPPVMSGNVLTRLQRDMKHLLVEFEKEYKHDLSLHLYSAHLLHLQNTNFPRRKYTQWPLWTEDVPVPNNNQYVQEPEEDISELLQQSQPLITTERSIPLFQERKKRKKTTPQSPFPENNQDGHSRETTPMTPSRQKKKKKILSEEFVPDDVLEEERLESIANGEPPVPMIKREGDSGDDVDKLDDIADEPYVPMVSHTQSMAVEIERAYKRKVYDRIHSSEIPGKEVFPTLDDLAIPDHVMKKVKSKLDGVLNSFGRSKRSRAVCYGWRDVLSEGSSNGAFLEKMDLVFDKDAREYLKEFNNQDELSVDEEQSESDGEEEDDQEDDEDEDEEDEEGPKKEHELTHLPETKNVTITDEFGNHKRFHTFSHKQTAQYLQEIRKQSSKILFEKELQQAVFRARRTARPKDQPRWLDNYDPFSNI